MMDLFLYTPDFDKATAAAALAAIPRHLPTSPLHYDAEQGIDPRPVTDPAAWMAARAPTLEASTLCNGDEDAYVGMATVLLPIGSIIDGERLFKTTLVFPEAPAFLAELPALLRTLGPAMGARWGSSTPGDAAFAILRGAGNKNPLPSRGSRFPRTPPRRPTMPGWINYWSYEACQLLEFSLERGHGALFARAEDVPGHGVFLQLTDEPLDLDQPEHMARLEALYDALPELARTDWH